MVRVRYTFEPDLSNRTRRVSSISAAQVGTKFFLGPTLFCYRLFPVVNDYLFLLSSSRGRIRPCEKICSSHAYHPSRATPRFLLKPAKTPFNYKMPLTMISLCGYHERKDEKTFLSYFFGCSLSRILCIGSYHFCSTHKQYLSALKQSICHIV